MNIIYSALLDYLKEIAFSLKDTYIPDARKKAKFFKIVNSVLKISKITKFIELYELIEDFSFIYKPYLVSNLNFFMKKNENFIKFFQTFLINLLFIYVDY